MATSTSSGDTVEWGAALVESSEEDRRARMRQRYLELLKMPEEQRVSALEKMAQAEYQMPDGKLRIFTESRLRVWLSLDLEDGRAIAHSYDAAMLRMSGVAAMKRVSTVQTVVRGFGAEDVEQLRELIPSILKEVPVIKAAQVAPPGRQREPVAAVEKPSRGLWGFWKRK